MQLFMKIVTFILGLPFQLQKLSQLDEIILACTKVTNDYMHAHAWILLSSSQKDFNKDSIKDSDLSRFKNGHGCSRGQTYVQVSL